LVAAAGAVGARIGGDVKDGAVDGEVDWEGGVAAVVEGELGGGEVDWAGLGGRRLFVKGFGSTVGGRLGQGLRRGDGEDLEG
jgi:hypothetical protein